MANEKKSTGKKAATAASEVLSDGRTSDASKSAAGSALSQANKKTTKATGEKSADKASEVLQRADTSKKSKTAAASALAQKKPGKK